MLYLQPKSNERKDSHIISHTNNKYQPQGQGKVLHICQMNNLACKYGKRSTGQTWVKKGKFTGANSIKQLFGPMNNEYDKQ